ncbi:hypothetical protein BESB_000370 [Besnoitia besnoiti]|uniref:Uncharacterized protein n=1 Tax=Besnoitia besnoiti TaxID=94643 RepID=A0A2A9MI82_BESBE|nr:hypothetical protein BESB_000370 [Besnoitia besnoiti]PFH37695.1 hypothetical protein BESB_000370 [Besnoitia besnoiti]
MRVLHRALRSPRARLQRGVVSCAFRASARSSFSPSEAAVSDASLRPSWAAAALNRTSRASALALSGRVCLIPSDSSSSRCLASRLRQHLSQRGGRRKHEAAARGNADAVRHQRETAAHAELPRERKRSLHSLPLSLSASRFGSKPMLLASSAPPASLCSSQGGGSTGALRSFLPSRLSPSWLPLRGLSAPNAVSARAVARLSTSCPASGARRAAFSSLALPGQPDLAPAEVASLDLRAQFRPDHVWRASPAELPALLEAASRAEDNENLRLLEREIASLAAGNGARDAPRGGQGEKEKDAGQAEREAREGGDLRMEEWEALALQDATKRPSSQKPLTLSGVAPAVAASCALSSSASSQPSLLASLRAKGVLPSASFWRHVQRRVEICEDLLSNAQLASLLLSAGKANAAPACAAFFFSLLSQRARAFLAAAAPSERSAFAIQSSEASPVSPSGSRSLSFGATPPSFLPPPLAVAVFNFALRQAATASAEDADSRNPDGEEAHPPQSSPRAPGASVGSRDDAAGATGAAGALSETRVSRRECELLMKALVVSLSRACAFFGVSTKSQSASHNAVKRADARALDAALLLTSCSARYAHLAQTCCLSSPTRSHDVLRLAVLFEEAVFPLLNASLPQMSPKQTVCLLHSLSRLTHHPVFFLSPSGAPYKGVFAAPSYASAASSASSSALVSASSTAAPCSLDLASAPAPSPPAHLLLRAVDRLASFLRAQPAEASEMRRNEASRREEGCGDFTRSSAEVFLSPSAPDPPSSLSKSCRLDSSVSPVSALQPASPAALLDPNSLSYALHSVFLLDLAVNAHLRLQQAPRSAAVSAHPSPSVSSFYLEALAPRLPPLLEALIGTLASPPSSSSAPSPQPASPSDARSAPTAAEGGGVSASGLSGGGASPRVFSTPKFASVSQVLRAFLPILTRQLLALPDLAALLLFHLARLTPALFRRGEGMSRGGLVALKREEDGGGDGGAGGGRLQQQHARQLYIFLLSSLVTQEPSLALAREPIASRLLPSPGDSAHLREGAFVSASAPASPAAASRSGSLEEFDAVEDAQLYLQTQQLSRDGVPSPFAPPSASRFGAAASTPASAAAPATGLSVPSFSSPSGSSAGALVQLDVSAVALKRSVRGTLRVALEPLLTTLPALSAAKLLQVVNIVLSTSSLRHPLSVVAQLLGELEARVKPSGAAEARARIALRDLGAVAAAGAQLVQIKRGWHEGARGAAAAADNPDARKSKEELQIAIQQQFRALLVAVAESAEEALASAEQRAGEGADDVIVENWSDDEGARVARSPFYETWRDDDGEAVDGGDAGEGGSEAAYTTAGETATDAAADATRTPGPKKRDCEDESSILHDPRALLELIAVFDVAGMTRPRLAALVARRILSYPRFREVFGLETPGESPVSLSTDVEREALALALPEAEAARGRRRRQRGEKKENDTAQYRSDDDGSGDVTHERTSSESFLHAHLEEIFHLLHFVADSGSSGAVASPDVNAGSSLFAHLLPPLSSPQLLASLSVELLLSALDTLRPLLRNRHTMLNPQAEEESAQDGRASISYSQTHAQSTHADPSRFGAGADSRPHAERFLFVLQKSCLTTTFLGSLRNGELLLLEELLRELGERNLRVEEERMQRGLSEPLPKRVPPPGALGPF